MWADADPDDEQSFDREMCLLRTTECLKIGFPVNHFITAGYELGDVPNEHTCDHRMPIEFVKKVERFEPDALGGGS